MSSKGIQYVEEETSALDLQHINVKLVLEHPDQLDLDALVNVFHSWIQEQVAEELLLDVADYRHVHHGPGILLIGHEADYSIDNTGGQLGLRYNRKAPVGGANQDRLTQAAMATLTAAERLVQDTRLNSKCSFNGREIEMFVNDRLVAPNTPQTRQLVEPEFHSFAQKLCGGAAYTLEFEVDPRRLFGVRIRTGEYLPTAALLENLSQNAHHDVA